MGVEGEGDGADGVGLRPQRGATTHAPLQHRKGRLTLAVAVRLAQLDVHHQPVTVLAEDVAQIAQLRLLLRSLAVEPRLGVRARDVRLAAATPAPEVHLRVAPTTRRWRWILFVPRTVALKRGPRLQQRPVHAEVVVREQPPAARLGHHLGEEGTRHLRLQQTLAVLGEGRGVEGLVLDVQVEEPLEEQVVAQLLAELALAAHREERDQETPLEQVLRWDRGASALRVHLLEAWRQLRQALVHQRLDAPQGMVVGDERLRHHRQHGVGLPLSLTAHREPPFVPPCSQLNPFSAPC